MNADLSTYELVDFLPFSPEVYFQLYASLNDTYWPLHLLVPLLIAAIAWRLRAGDPRAVWGALALPWAFLGGAFFFDRYAELLWAAPYFGAGFVVQSALLGLYGFRDQPAVEDLSGAFAWIGAAVAAAGLFALPLLGPLLTERSWASAEVFGFAPDPTVVTTLGLLLIADRTPWILVVIPVLWCIVTGLTFIAMDQPLGLITPALGGIVLLAALTRAILLGDEDRDPADDA